MAYRQAITERVKFLIQLIISRGIATNQEDLGRKMGIESKSYLSQLVNSKQNNTEFLNKLSALIPEFNKEWLYNEGIEIPFLSEKLETSLLLADRAIGKEAEALQERVKELSAKMELLQKDVHYYADMADSRLQTINLQSLAIEKLSKLVDLLEKQLTPAK